MNNIFLNGSGQDDRLQMQDRMSGSLRPESSYYHTDHVDSVKVVTNDSGMVVTSHEYLPFGEDWITEGDTKNAPKYNSQELDKESGYYFYNARHYDPEIGRFVAADSVIDGEGSTQGWNRYAYVHNNPIEYKDPTGHLKDKDVQNAVYDAAYSWSSGHRQRAQEREFNDIKSDLIKNLDKNQCCSDRRTRSSSVTIGNKTVEVVFTKTFCETWGKSNNYKSVIEGMDSKALGIYLKTAAEKDVTKITIEGFGRPDAQSKSNPHGHYNSKGDKKPSYGIDVVGLEFANKEKLTPKDFKWENKNYQNFVSGLKSNVEKYAPNSKGFLIDPESYRKFNIDQTNNKWDVKETRSGDVHKERPHQHFSIMP